MLYVYVENKEGGGGMERERKVEREERDTVRVLKDAKD